MATDTRMSFLVGLRRYCCSRSLSCVSSKNILRVEALEIAMLLLNYFTKWDAVVVMVEVVVVKESGQVEMIVEESEDDWFRWYGGVGIGADPSVLNASVSLAEGTGSIVGTAEESAQSCRSTVTPVLLASCRILLTNAHHHPIRWISSST
ncbi:hypothetical protein Tco_0508881 [Tanacetum coccineum]